MALDDPIQKLSRLTERQLEILRLRCEGREILPITFELHETESVVKQEIGRIYVKLGLDKLTRIQRFKALFEIYCPALKEAELPTPEPEPEELEPVPKEVEEMIEEDERALVPLQPKPLVPNEKRQPPPQPRRSPGLLVGIVLGVLLAVVIFYALGRLPGTGEAPTVGVTATSSVQETEAPVVEYREVTVEVTTTPAPAQDTATPADQTPVATEAPAVVTVTPAPPQDTPRPLGRYRCPCPLKTTSTRGRDLNGSQCWGPGEWWMAPTPQMKQMGGLIRW